MTAPVLVLDIETAPLPNAADYLDPPEAAKNLRDPVKIAADLAEKASRQREDCARDWHVGRIVAAGYWRSDYGLHADQAWVMTTGASDPLTPTDGHERDLLAALWRATRPTDDGVPVTLCGFGLRQFDVPFLLTRSLYLGVPAPTLDLGRYARDGRIVDLYDLLTFDKAGIQGTRVMRRSLSSFCRRFGITEGAEDTVRGEDVPRLVAEGRWSEIAAHCRADVRRTVALTRRLGVL